MNGDDLRRLSQTDKFYGKALQIMVGPGRAMALTTRVVSLAYWIAMIGAIGWLMSQAFDREPPVDILSTEMLTETVRPGDPIRVRYHLIRHRVCRTESSWVILDGISEYRRFGPVVAEAVGRVGDDTFVKGWTLPLGAAPGAGRLRTITTWRCEGNFLHAFYPIVRVGPDLHFRIEAAGAR